MLGVAQPRRGRDRKVSVALFVGFKTIMSLAVISKTLRGVAARACTECMPPKRIRQESRALNCAANRIPTA